MTADPMDGMPDETPATYVKVKHGEKEKEENEKEKDPK